MLSSHAEDGHQMYFGDSVVGKASTIGIGISYTPPVIFTGGQKVRNLASFKTSLNFEPPTFENAARYKKARSVLTHPLKLHATVDNSAVDYSISIKFCTECKRMTLEML